MLGVVMKVLSRMGRGFSSPPTHLYKARADQYSFFDHTWVAQHPFYRLRDLNASARIAPAAVMSTMVVRDGIATTRGVMYVPRGISVTAASGRMDVVMLPSIRGRANIDVRVKLTRSARIFVLLTGRHRDILNARSVTGLGRFSHPHVQFLANASTSISHRTPHKALAVYADFDKGQVNISQLQRIRVDGWRPQGILLLVGGSGGRAVVNPIAGPGVPDISAVSGILGQDGMHLDTLEAPEPGSPCPKWLHDLHVVRNQHSDDGQPQYWRTWHPAIDVVYRCHYRHEHGTSPYPYMPPYGETAFNTPSGTTRDGRQDESHEGFKTFSIQPDDSTALVVTVHARVSRAMRVHMRFHTVNLVLLKRRATMWVKVVDVQAKQDFGPAMVTYKNGTHVSVDAAQESIASEVRKPDGGFSARRRFMVVPGSPNLGDFQSTEYEFWDFSPPCSTGILRVDIRDRASGLRSLDGETGTLPGASINRVLPVHSDSFTMSRSRCVFADGSQLGAGQSEFFTDPYFRELHESTGDFRLRQYVAGDLHPFTLSRDMWFPNNPITGRLTLKDVGVVVENVEGAVSPSEN